MRAIAMINKMHLERPSRSECALLLSLGMVRLTAPFFLCGQAASEGGLTSRSSTAAKAMGAGTVDCHCHDDELRHADRSAIRSRRPLPSIVIVPNTAAPPHFFQVLVALSCLRAVLAILLYGVFQPLPRFVNAMVTAFTNPSIVIVPNTAAPPHFFQLLVALSCLRAVLAILLHGVFQPLPRFVNAMFTAFTICLCDQR